MSDDPSITVLGGGPAGLAAGFYARRRGLDVRLYEAADSVGGNARTLRLGPFRYDTGAHRFHDKEPSITADVKALLGDDLRRVEAPSQIQWRGRRIDFPLAPYDLLRKLPLRLLARVAVEQLSAGRRPGTTPSHFEEMARQSYGPTLARLFLLNYTEKLWGRPPHRLSPDVAGSRLEGLDLKTFLMEAFATTQRKARHLDGAFLYPKHGYGMIAEATADALGREHIRTGARVTRLVHDGERLCYLEVNGERVPAETVVSTLPLTLVVRLLDPAPPAALQAVARLVRFRHLRLAVFGLPHRSRVSPNASLYFPSAQVPFTRLYEPKNRSAAMAPDGKTAVVMELPCDPEAEVWHMDEAALRQLARRTLVEQGLIEPNETAIFASHKIPFAYPVLEVGTEAKAQRLRDYLRRFSNLHLLGRSACFSYTHVHNLYADARHLARRLASSANASISKSSA
jgi:protoporphyrinogen oxidase